MYQSPSGIATECCAAPGFSGDARSGDDVRRVLVFQEADPVLQVELAALQALHLQLVWRALVLQRGDGVVQIAVLLAQVHEFGGHIRLLVIADRVVHGRGILCSGAEARVAGLVAKRWPAIALTARCEAFKDAVPRKCDAWPIRFACYRIKQRIGPIRMAFVLVVHVRVLRHPFGSLPFMVRILNMAAGLRATGFRAAGLAGLALAVATGGAACVQAAEFEADYGISLLGLPLGSANIKGTVSPGSYKIDMTSRLSGLAGAFTGGKGGGSASGGLTNGRIVPSAFAVTAASSSEQRTVRVSLPGGNVAAASIEPPLDEKIDRVPVLAAHKRGIIDPISALLMPVPASAADQSAVCNRTIPIFDGAARYDIRMSFSSARQVQTNGYSGPAIICAVRYVPISGHRSERKATKFMAENRDISVWLVPLAGTAIMVPFRVSVKTMIGTAVMEASRLESDGGTTATVRR